MTIQVTFLRGSKTEPTLLHFKELHHVAMQLFIILYRVLQTLQRSFCPQESYE